MSSSSSSSSSSVPLRSKRWLTRRSLPLFYLSLIAVGTTESDGRSQNLVFNPSFETDGGTPETADGWELFGAGGDVTRLTTMPNTGRAHIRLAGDPLEGANFAVLVQRDLPVTPASDYAMDLFVRGDPVDGQVGYRVEFYNSGGGLIGGMFDNNVIIDPLLTTEYQEFSNVFTAPANAATGVIVVFWELLNGLTVIDVDDVGFALATGEDSADFNGDGLVDGRDFAIWQRNAGGAGGPASGDANDDGLVNDADLGIWELQYGVGSGRGERRFCGPRACLLDARQPRSPDNDGKATLTLRFSLQTTPNRP